MSEKPQMENPQTRSNSFPFNMRRDSLENQFLDVILSAQPNASNASTQDQEAFLSRSSKKRIQRRYENSFELGILQSHKKAFQNILSHFEKQQKKILGKFAISYLLKEEESQFSEYNFNADVSNLIDTFSRLNPEQRKQYQEDMKNQNQLSNFLIYMTEAVDSRLITEILTLNWMIWEIYLSCRKEEKRLKNLIDLIKERILKEFQNTVIEENFKQFTENDGPAKKNKINQAFVKFAQELSQTIMLVIEGYFDNPDEQNQQKHCDLECQAYSGLEKLQIENSQQKNIETNQ